MAQTMGSSTKPPVAVRGPMMNKMTRRVTRLGRVVAVSAVTVAAFALSVTPANAAMGTISVSLSIRSNPGCAPDRLQVFGEVLVRMPVSEANANISKYGLQLEGWGDDDWTNGGDDLEFGPFSANSVNVVPAGLLYTYGPCIRKSDLNEDSGGDEIFVKAKVNDPQSVIHTKNSITVHGSW